MPYKKRYKKRYKRKNSYYRSASNTLNIASKALTVAYGVKRLMNVEYKVATTTGVNTTLPDGVGTIVELTNLSQGDTTNTRDGSSVKFTSWDFKGIVKINASATIDSFINVMLVEDRQTNSAIYTTAQLLSSVVNVTSVVTQLNINNKFRFHIHRRWILPLSIAGKSSHVLKFHKKLDMKVRYDANAGDITDLASRSLSLVFISSEATNVPTITFSNRLRYLDN